MAGNDDLFTGLKMLQSGVQQLQLSRAVQGANDQVQQIKQSEMDDAAKRQALTSTANQLVMHMAAMGTPDSTIQSVKGAIAPQQYANGMDMYRQGLLQNDPSLVKMGLMTQKQEEQPAMDKLAQQYKFMSPMRAMAMKEKQDEFTTKQFGDFSKTLDATAASGRSAFGLGGQTLQRAGRIQALMGDPSQWANLNQQDATLIGEGLANLVKGGVATEQELRALVPKTTGTLSSDVAQFLTNKPQSAQLQAFMQKYSDIVDRESTENKMQLQDTILKRASGNMILAKRNPDQFKVSVAQNLSQYGMPTSPDDVIIDPKKGVTTTQMQNVQNTTDAASTLLKKAYTAVKSPKADPNDLATAQAVFSRAGLDPNLPMSQNMDLLRKKIRISVGGGK